MTPCGGSSIAASISKRNVIYPIWNIKLADRQETSVRLRVSLALGASISACLLGSSYRDNCAWWWEGLATSLPDSPTRQSHIMTRHAPCVAHRRDDLAGGKHAAQPCHTASHWCMLRLSTPSCHSGMSLPVEAGYRPHARSPGLPAWRCFGPYCASEGNGQLPSVVPVVLSVLWALCAMRAIVVGSPTMCNPSASNTCQSSIS